MANDVNGYTCHVCGCKKNKMFWSESAMALVVVCGNRDCGVELQTHDESMWTTVLPMEAKR